MVRLIGSCQSGGIHLSVVQIPGGPDPPQCGWPGRTPDFRRCATCGRLAPRASRPSGRMGLRTEARLEEPAHFPVPRILQSRGPAR